ncbi:MAG: DUF4093 domain-containing protein [Clostridia bacterium]|nr:DUF4093 domain-containing protein [Clostridia bacterium]
MIKIREAIIVEGKYDKIKLTSVVDTCIIETNGFRIFKDKEKRNLIRKLADECGIIILTDSDSAGFVIRNHIKGITSSENIKNAYIPQIEGKEKRKDKYSKEGLLGVEGISESDILNALKQCGACFDDGEKTENEKQLTKLDFYELGLTGMPQSAELRKKVLNYLKLPSYMTSNSMLQALNRLTDKETLKQIINSIKK